MSIIRKQVHFRLFIIILSSAAVSNHEILSNSAEFVPVIACTQCALSVTILRLFANYCNIQDFFSPYDDPTQMSEGFLL